VRIGVVGTGRVGSALALSLASARGGVRLAGVLSRRPARARRLVGRCRKGRAFTSVEDLGAGCDLIILCIPDGRIEEAAERIARGTSFRGRIVLHTSGVLSSRPLRSLRRRGVLTGTLHPLAAVPPASAGAPVPAGITFAVGGDRGAVAAARRIARSLRGRPLVLPERLRPAYHLAATMVANHATVITSLALDLLGKKGISPSPPIRRAMAALLRTAADRIGQEGPARGLTGPAARGDLGTLRTHLVLLGRSTRLRALYAALSAEAIRIARRRGDLPRRRAEAALRLLLSRRAAGR